MSDEKFHGRYRIASTRAEWHDYGEGVYFVTICTQGREHYFGKIDNGLMCLTEIGRYAEKCIHNTTKHNCYAEIPLFVVMPDHVHLIVIIREFVANCRDGACTVSTAESKTINLKNNRWKHDMVDKTMQKISQRKNKLSFAIGNIKSAITRFAHSNNIPFGWQPRFHDHIIRNHNELNQIVDYIESNVANWEDN